MLWGMYRLEKNIWKGVSPLLFRGRGFPVVSAPGPPPCWLAWGPPGPPSPVGVLGLWTCATSSGFLMCALGSNSACQACPPSALSTQPALQPTHNNYAHLEGII